MSMNGKKPLYKVPVPSTSFTSEAALCEDVIRFAYERESTEYRTGIRFKRVWAGRTRAESACTEWHIAGAYDTLVEVEGSPWLAELRAATADIQRRHGEKWEMHHYMIYLDSTGCFEFIAEG